jgi:hypothetical protein
MVSDILCGEAPPSLSSPDPALRNPAQGHRYVFWGDESGCFQFLSSNTACWLFPSGRLHRKNVKDRWQKTAIHLCTSNKTSSFVSRFCSFVEFFAPQSLLTHLQWTQSVYHSAQPHNFKPFFGGWGVSQHSWYNRETVIFSTKGTTTKETLSSAVGSSRRAGLSPLCPFPLRPFFDWQPHRGTTWRRWPFLLILFYHPILLPTTTCIRKTLNHISYLIHSFFYISTIFRLPGIQYATYTGICFCEPILHYNYTLHMAIPPSPHTYKTNTNVECNLET